MGFFSPSLNTITFPKLSTFISSADINKEKILNIGVNISGRVNPELGYSFSMFNFEERPLAEVISEKIGYRVTIDNDTRAMTYGEMVKGLVRGEKNIIFINLSWGIGAGLIINGDIFTGKSGFSGEFGHFNVFDICHNLTLLIISLYSSCNVRLCYLLIVSTINNLNQIYKCQILS